MFSENKTQPLASTNKLQPIMTWEKIRFLCLVNYVEMKFLPNQALVD